DAIEAAVLGGEATAIENRSGPFAQRHDAPVIGDERDELAVTPHAALVDRSVGQPALPPRGFPFSGTGLRRAVGSFQESAAARTVVNHLCGGIPRAALLLEANQLYCHEAFIIEACSRFTWKTARSACANCPCRSVGKGTRCCAWSWPESVTPTWNCSAATTASQGLRGTNSWAKWWRRTPR